MLDCCQPLEKVQAQGITFGKVAYLAHSVGASVEAFRMNQTSIDDFERHVVSCASSENCHLIASYHRGLFKQRCKHESWVTSANFLIEDVPYLLMVEGIDNVQKVLSTIFTSLAFGVDDFVKWVAKVQMKEEGVNSLSKEEKTKLDMKGELLRLVHESELYKHVSEWLASAICCCKGVSSPCENQTLNKIVAKVCSQGAKLLAGRMGSLVGSFRCK